MLELRGVSRAFGGWKSPNEVLSNVYAQFDRRSHYVIFGAKGVGKTTFLRLLCGLDVPTHGRVVRRGVVSPPVGSVGFIARRETPRKVVDYFAHLYGADPHEMMRWVEGLSNLGEDLDGELKYLNAFKRARLNFSIGYGVPADYYLFDNHISIGDKHQKQRFDAAFAARQKTATTILATRDTRSPERYGDRGGVLRDGQLHMFSTVKEAVEFFHESNQAKQPEGVARATAMISTASVAKAKDYLAEYLTRNERDADANAMMAEMSLKTGDAKSAVEHAWSALLVDPDSTLAYFVLARIAEQDGRPIDAVAYCERALELSPQHRDAIPLLARAYENLDLSLEAATVWREIADMMGPGSLALRMSIRNDLRAQNWTRLMDSADFGLAANPRDANLLEMRLRALQEMGRWNEAGETLFALARSDLERAFGAIQRLTKTDEWARIIESLERLREEFDLTSKVDSRALSHTLLFLRRKAVMEKRGGSFDAAEEIIRLVKSIDPKS